MQVWIRPTAASSAFLHTEKAKMHLFLAALTALAVSAALSLHPASLAFTIPEFLKHVYDSKFKKNTNL